LLGSPTFEVAQLLHLAQDFAYIWVVFCAVPAPASQSLIVQPAEVAFRAVQRYHLLASLTAEIFAAP